MTATLLRHEFLRTRGMLGVITGVAALLTVVGSLLALAPMGALAAIGMMVAMATVIGLVPVVLLALAVDYWRSAYGRTGYFTHSLPVSGARIYGTRLLYGGIVALAAMILTAILALAPILVAAFDEAPERGLDVALQAGREIFALARPSTWVLGGVALFLTVCAYLVHYYFAATIGSGPRLAPLGAFGPVLVWVALYLVLQVASFVSILLVPYGIRIDAGSWQLVPVDYSGVVAAMSETSGETSSDIMPFGFVPVHVVVTAVLAWWTAREWNHVDLR